MMYGANDLDLAPGEAWDGDGCPGVAFNFGGRTVFVTEWESTYARKATPEDWSLAEYLIGLVKKDTTKGTQP